MTEVLDPLRLPLHGSRLIEASAGTGKTWTIATLVVRLVAGHGCEPRQPREILVMTFTRAATRELSERIRQRLQQAAACLRGEAGEASLADDAFMTGLVSEFAPGASRQQAAWRLAMAAEAMDEAAVHTIDAWCQRMLREHAFDSGCLFDEELQAHEAAMLAQAVRDYWRQQVYPLDDATLQQVLSRWKDIAALEQDLKPLFGKPLPAAAGQGSLADAAARAARQRADTLAQLKSGWPQHAGQMLEWLTPIWADKKHPGRKAVPAETHARRWIEQLCAWACDPHADQPGLTQTAEQRLAASTLQQRLTECGAAIPVAACFAEFESLLGQLKSLPEPSQALRLHAAAQVEQRLQLLKSRAGRFGFADMLIRLDRALDPAAHGASAQRLRERILAQYPVALIDEFQDTSPLQLRIFDRLYRIADNDASRTLLLVGDPKQAIYQFRGADIYSYLQARRATAGRHHLLDTNHRATAALVAAVNTLFDTAEARPGEGAFMFGGPAEPSAPPDTPDAPDAPDAPGAASQLPFVPVRAKGRAQRLVCSNGAVPALTLVADELLCNKQDSQRLYAALCAERIVALLNDPQAGFDEPGQPFRRLQPADIAVLVRSGAEADAVRLELRRRGLASVYLSDKDSVFTTPEAADLLRLLQAVAAPRDMRLARAALATPLLGLTLPELLRLACDDQAFDRECDRLRQLHQVWQGQGVLAMVRQALHEFQLPARWLAGDDPGAAGERRLTNLLHLAELLQAAAAQVQGEPPLVRWLLQQCADAEAGLHHTDDAVLRLESDADLVQVVTVHKSKGLEYSVVFLPFAAHFREVVVPGQSAKDAVLLLPRADGSSARELVLGPTKQQIALEEKEQQREQLRLLYVALTRARHALWVGLSALQSGAAKTDLWHRSAVGYLLSGAQPQPLAQRALDLQALADASAEVELQWLAAADDLPLPPLSRLQMRAAATALRAPSAYSARFERDWSISSYSALLRDAAGAVAGCGAVPARLARDDTSDDESSGTGARPLPRTEQPWHRFPRGALAGNFLHDQLEWLAGEGFALDASPELQQRLRQRCERQGWGHRADDVVAWLRRVCSTPLPVAGTPLCTVRQPLPEMEFWMPSDGLQASRLDVLCRQHLLPGQPRPPLPQRALKGLLMGFVDLVFEHEGRYWVLDYKSNALGPGDADYSFAAMHAAMLEHRYDVQAALYLLALHRLLAARLGPAYDPARQLGGAVYLFLRGINGAAAGCCPVAAPPALIGAIDAMLPASPASATARQGKPSKPA